jgi:SAM-dependent methyltransferase
MLAWSAGSRCLRACGVHEANVGKGEEDRPWRSRILEPVRVPATKKATLELLETLTEIQAHREWVIDGLRAHVANLEQRLSEVDLHASNLERELEGVQAHAANLEERLAEREARLAEVERHAANLERRQGRRTGRLSAEGIFPKVPFPRLDALFRIAERLLAARPDLRERFPPDRAADLWYWLLWHGATSHRELGTHLYPTPDRHLIERVVGEGTSPDEYRRSGLVDWWTIDGCLREAGFDPARGGEVLDLGVGCGRIIQHFALYAGSCRLSGSDVDAEAIAWCRANLDFGSFETHPVEPPTPFAGGRFDAVYAFSVFSHLPERLQRAWISELARITRSGAAVALTTHGRHAVEEVLAGRRLLVPPGPRDLARRRGELERDGFLFFPYRSLGFAHSENRRFFEAWDLDQYGNAFMLEPYVRTHWGESFELVAHHEAPDDWQDYIVLKRR